MTDDEECKNSLTILSLLTEIAHSNNKIITTYSSSSSSSYSKKFLTFVYEFFFNPENYRIFYYHPDKVAKILRYLVETRGAFTRQTRDIVGAQGIVWPSNILHEIMRSLEEYGLVRKSLHKPFQGGRRFALWAGAWATNQDVQSAIEEHNMALEHKASQPAPAKSERVKCTLNPRFKGLEVSATICAKCQIDCEKRLGLEEVEPK